MELEGEWKDDRGKQSLILFTIDNLIIDSCNGKLIELFIFQLRRRNLSSKEGEPSVANILQSKCDQPG